MIVYQSHNKQPNETEKRCWCFYSICNTVGLCNNFQRIGKYTCFIHVRVPADKCSTRDDFKAFEIILRAKLRQINYQGMKNCTALRITIQLKDNYNSGRKLTGEDSGKRLYKAVCQCGNRCFYFVRYNRCFYFVRYVIQKRIREYKQH